MDKGMTEEEATERFRADLEVKYGSASPEDGKVVQGEDLIGFDKYVDYQENMKYIFLMHAQRIIMLTKLVNKSYEIRNQERQKKQMRAQASSSDIVDIEMDLFQINQVLKNEIGKDVDMIESFMQESLKAIYVTVLEYLQNVPQEEPEFLRAEAAEEQQ